MAQWGSAISGKSDGFGGCCCRGDQQSCAPSLAVQAGINIKDQLNGMSTSAAPTKNGDSRSV